MIRPALPRFTRFKRRFKTGGRILSSPVVTVGTVYFGSDDHHLHALRLATGVERWKFKSGGRIPSTPAIADGLLFFLSYDANFDAVDAATGTLKWKFPTGGEHRFSAKHLHGIEPAGEIMPIGLIFICRLLSFRARCCVFRLERRKCVRARSRNGSREMEI